MPKQPSQKGLRLTGDDDDGLPELDLEEGVDFDDDDDGEVRQPEFLSVKELKRHAAELIADLNGTLPLAYITEHGDPRAVILSFDFFQTMSSMALEAAPGDDEQDDGSEEQADVVVIDDQNEDDAEDDTVIVIDKDNDKIRRGLKGAPW